MTDGDGSVAGDAGRGGQLAYVIGPIANSMFRLRMVDGREIVAHAAKDLRMAFTRLLPDDQVLVELSAFDPDKARIRKVLKSSRPSQHASIQVAPSSTTPSSTTPNSTTPNSTTPNSEKCREGQS